MPKDAGGAGRGVSEAGGHGAGHLRHRDARAVGGGSDHRGHDAAPGGGIPAADPAVSAAYARRREGILRQLGADLKPGRLGHSLSVERVAIDLAQRHGLPVEEAAEAGLLHDNAHNMSLAELQGIAREAGLAVDEEMFESTALLHAPVGALRAERVYGVMDNAVLSAIRWHTTGKPEMTPLEMIIYLADTADPGRTPFPAQQDIAMLARENLDEAMLLALSRGIEYIRQRGRHVHEDTQRAFLYYLEKTNA